jgi:hypothetical protein
VTNLAKGFLFAFLVSLLFVSRASAVNDQNNLLLKQTPAEQAEFLSQVVGHGCTGKDAWRIAPIGAFAVATAVSSK